MEDSMFTGSQSTSAFTMRMYLRVFCPECKTEYLGGEEPDVQFLYCVKDMFYFKNPNYQHNYWNL